MKLYNTLTRQIDQIEPISPPSISVYTCGPTVYDYAHIGHWFNYVRMDTLIRILKTQGMNPMWVMNITDVGHLVSDNDHGEDKLEKGAKREGKTAWEVAAFYTNDFIEGMKLLNMLEPNHIVKATDHIQEQIALIATLENKGYVYQIDDGMYYDTSKFPGYAAFARLDLDDLQAGARVSFNPQKRNISDFALWKFSPIGTQRDMEWDSPWGKGFPGWHIECSAMSMHYLGPTLDIHTGGIDHIPTHHTNEIAQSEAATGQRFANVWMHSNHVLIEGEKVSKSIGNGIHLQEIIDKHIPLSAFRLHVLESHYRTQSKFTWESLDAAKNRLEDLQAFAALRYQAIKNGYHVPQIVLKDISAQLIELLGNDLDTPKALAYVSSITNQFANTLLEESMVEPFTEVLELLDDLFGLNLLQLPDITEDQHNRINERQVARDNKDWQVSDQIREALLKEQIALKDTDAGAIWFRVM